MLPLRMTTWPFRTSGIFCEEFSVRRQTLKPQRLPRSSAMEIFEMLVIDIPERRRHSSPSVPLNIVASFCLHENDNRICRAGFRKRPKTISNSMYLEDSTDSWMCWLNAALFEKDGCVRESSVPGASGTTWCPEDAPEGAEATGLVAASSGETGGCLTMVRKKCNRDGQRCSTKGQPEYGLSLEVKLLRIQFLATFQKCPQLLMTLNASFRTFRIMWRVTLCLACLLTAGYSRNRLIFNFDYLKLQCDRKALFCAYDEVPKDNRSF